MSDQIAAYRADRDAFGHLLVDHLDGRLQIIEREDGLLLSAGDSRPYFAESAEWVPREQEAMRWVVPGRALDLGCGAGRVPLYLQDAKLYAARAEPSACSIARRRRRSGSST